MGLAHRWRLAGPRSAAVGLVVLLGGAGGGCGAPGAGDDTPDAASPRCGDGVVDEELGEYCDDGARNGTESSTCMVECWQPTIVWTGEPWRVQLDHPPEVVSGNTAYMTPGRDEIFSYSPAIGGGTPLPGVPVQARPTSIIVRYPDVLWIEPPAGPGQHSRLFCFGPETHGQPLEQAYPFADGTGGSLTIVADDSSPDTAVLVDHSGGPESELLVAWLHTSCPPSGALVRAAARLGPAPGRVVGAVLARDFYGPTQRRLHVVVVYQDTERFVVVEGDGGNDAPRRDAGGIWTQEIVDWVAWYPWWFEAPLEGAPFVLLLATGEILLWRFHDGVPGETSSAHFGWVPPGTRAIQSRDNMVFALGPDGVLRVLHAGSIGYPTQSIAPQTRAVTAPYRSASSDVLSREVFAVDSSTVSLHSGDGASIYEIRGWPFSR